MAHQETVWDLPREALSEHLDRIADELDVFAECVGGHTSATAGEQTSSRPFFCRARFSDVAVSVEFIREDDQLRYAARISRYRQVLAEGPTGLVDVHDGFAAAAGDISRAFARITRFVDRRKPLIRHSCQTRLPG
jgi:hypothetical protein